MFQQQKKETCTMKSKSNSGFTICFKKLHKCKRLARAVLFIGSHTTQLLSIIHVRAGDICHPLK
ncbi:MAG: hypothetical protein ABIH28_02260, partial [archaeon]